jgi:Tol biopolymer transport system component
VITGPFEEALFLLQPQESIMRICALLCVLFPAGVPAGAAEKTSLRSTWEMPPRCTPFAAPRIKDLKEELRQTGYRLVIAIHQKSPAPKDAAPPPRDLYIVNADGSALKQVTNTPEKDERVPRTAPNGKMFTYNYGDYLVDVASLKTRAIYGGYVWAPDSTATARCEKRGIVFVDIATGAKTKPIRVERRVSITDLSFDGRWFVFEIRNFRGSKYSIDFMSSQGGPIRKLPNHPLPRGECHPAFSPDGEWLCWNGGGSLAIRKFDPSLPAGTEGAITTLAEKALGQDPCGRWSHCGRYIAYVKIPHRGSWKVHSPLCIVRIADGETVTISPPGWVGHHWDYDWLPPAE